MAAMSRALPPLNALRAFEAAARHLSFTKAAAELRVTQAAISHQVKSLEAHLGAKLFKRLTRALALTETGAMLAPEIGAAFERISGAIARASERDARGVLSVSLLTTFAISWFVPRLGRFNALHPGIEVRLQTTPRLVDFAREDVDVAIRYGRGGWAGLAADKLFDDDLTPLCAPAIAKRLKRPADLLHVPLLVLYDDPGEWPLWLAAAGVADRPTNIAAAFDSTRIAVEGAMEGIGVAIGSPIAFAGDLASGRLVRPFALRVPTGRAYWLVYPHASAARPKVAAFRSWLVAEAEAARAASPPASPRPGRTADRAAAASPRSATRARAPGRDGGSGG